MNGDVSQQDGDYNQSSPMERLLNRMSGRDRTTENIQNEILNNKKQLDELLDRFFYSSIEIIDEKPDYVEDVDEEGKPYRRKIKKKFIRYQKLPTDIKIINCHWIASPATNEHFTGKYIENYKDEDTNEENLNPLIIEYSESSEGQSLIQMEKHLASVHKISFPINKIRTYARYRDWQPMMNRAGLDAIKSYLLGLTSPIISTTKYKDDANEEYSLKLRSLLDSKGAVLNVIQNHREYEFDYEDGSKVRAMTLFLFELIDAVKKRSIGGFVYKGIVQSTNINENRNYNLTPRRQSMWDNIKGSGGIR